MQHFSPGSLQAFAYTNSRIPFDRETATPAQQQPRSDQFRRSRVAERSQAAKVEAIAMRARLTARVRRDSTRQGIRILELLLEPRIGTKRARQAARQLLHRFDSVTGALAAPRCELLRIAGIGPATAAYLHLLLQAACFVAIERIDSKKPVFCNIDQVHDYLRLQMGFLLQEQLRILFLNKGNRLILDEVSARGTIDNVPCYPREILKRALEVGATALVLIHNHPGGSAMPSAVDVALTREVADIGKSLGIIVHDHLIVTDTEIVSMRRLGKL